MLYLFRTCAVVRWVGDTCQACLRLYLKESELYGHVSLHALVFVGENWEKGLYVLAFQRLVL